MRERRENEMEYGVLFYIASDETPTYSDARSTLQSGGRYGARSMDRAT